jgi:hypothetical protein
MTWDGPDGSRSATAGAGGLTRPEAACVQPTIQASSSPLNPTTNNSKPILFIFGAIIPNFFG